MSRLLCIVALLAGCKDIPNEQPATTGSGAGTGIASGMQATPKPAFAIAYERVPLEAPWKDAAKVTASAWAESFNKIGVTTAKVTPMTAPDGAMAPYVLRIEGLAGTESKFKGIALVSKGSVINGGGVKRLEAHFQMIKFPAETKLSIGHLVQMLELTRAVDKAWLVTPDTIEWAYDKPRGTAQHVPATLTYDDTGAVLTLYRDGASGLERLEVRFDKAGLMTKQAARQPAGSSAWQPFTE